MFSPLPGDEAVGLLLRRSKASSIDAGWFAIPFCAVIPFVCEDGNGAHGSGCAGCAVMVKGKIIVLY